MYLRVIANIVSRKMMSNTLELSPYKTCPKSILLVRTDCDEEKWTRVWQEICGKLRRGKIESRKPLNAALPGVKVAICRLAQI